jgi:hypothetical protein
VDGDVGEAVVYQGRELPGIDPEPASGEQQGRAEPEEELAERAFVFAPKCRDQRLVAHRGAPAGDLTPSGRVLVHEPS